MGKRRYVKGRVTLPTRPLRHLSEHRCSFKYWLRQGSLVGKNGEYRVQKIEAERKGRRPLLPSISHSVRSFLRGGPRSLSFSPNKEPGPRADQCSHYMTRDSGV